MTSILRWSVTGTSVQIAEQQVFLHTSACFPTDEPRKFRLGSLVEQQADP